jgi:hypothetical protein
MRGNIDAHSGVQKNSINKGLKVREDNVLSRAKFERGSGIIVVDGNVVR